MPHSGTITFLTYWRGLQTSPESAPARDLFDPARLKRLIPQMLMLQATDDDYSFRLSGGFLVALNGRELKSEGFVELFRDPFHAPLKTALLASRRHQQPLILEASAPWLSEDRQGSSRDETVGLEICLCPLSGPDGQIDRFVGVFQAVTAPPKSVRGKVGTYSLIGSRLHEPRTGLRAGHLQLVSLEGRRIA